MAIKYYVPMTAQSPPTWFQKYKMRPQTQDDMYIYTLAGSCIWGTISKNQNGMPMVARKAFNISEVWNLLCCHVEFVLWSTFSRILLQRIKHSNTTYKQIGWDIILHYIWSKFGEVYDVITWLICIFLKLEYLWNKKKIPVVKMVNSIFFSYRIPVYVLKYLR